MAADRPGTPAVGTRTDSTLVVVVDSDRREVARIARVAAEAGHAVISATDGRSALRQVFESGIGPSLLLTAIELPVMSGIELAARMTAARPGLRVILLSSDPAAVDRARAHPGLAHGALLEPVDVSGLRIAMAAALAEEPRP